MIWQMVLISYLFRLLKKFEAIYQQDRQRVEKILSYDEDTAGGLMNTDSTSSEGIIIELVLRYLRRHQTLPEMTDNIS